MGPSQLTSPAGSGAKVNPTSLPALRWEVRARAAGTRTVIICVHRVALPSFCLDPGTVPNASGVSAAQAAQEASGLHTAVDNCLID